MTRPLTLARAVLLLAAASFAFSPGAPAAAAVEEPAYGDHSGHDRHFERFLRKYEAANSAFVNGDPSLWRTIAADRNPVSIFGGFGGLGEAGLEEVNARYELAARAFQPSGAVVEFEYLVRDVRGRLAYTVAIERSDVRYTGADQRTLQELRVTMVFRRDHGAWRIVHRHADTMIDLELPGT